MVRYGAKALPEGGWLTLPECAVDGALIVGDAAGFLNSHAAERHSPRDEDGHARG